MSFYVIPISCDPSSEPNVFLQAGLGLSHLLHFGELNNPISVGSYFNKKKGNLQLKISHFFERVSVQCDDKYTHKKAAYYFRNLGRAK